MGRLILARACHAEGANGSNPSDWGLSERGREDAATLGAELTRLLGGTPAHIQAGTQRRSLETAELIVGARGISILGGFVVPVNDRWDTDHGRDFTESQARDCLAVADRILDDTETFPDPALIIVGSTKLIFGMHAQRAGRPDHNFTRPVDFVELPPGSS